MSQGAAHFAFFTAAGLNRQHVFALAELPPEIRAQIERQIAGQSELDTGTSQLILLAHAGRLLWERVQASNLPGTDPIDDYTVACVHDFFTSEMPGVAYRILYPGPAVVGLQALGHLAGWHHAAPFMLGMAPDWGSWFAYRALIVAASNFPLSQPLAHAHPCATCRDPVCRSACPGEALRGPFNLAACAAYRLQPASACAANCLARRACPLGRAHAYSAEQMRHSYSRSLSALRAWQENYYENE